MLTSHVNCLEETGHHVEAHGMWHMLYLKDCGIGLIKQRRLNSRIMHCSMSKMNVKSQDLRHFCENRAYIQRLTHLGQHTIEVAHDPDLTIPGAYN